MCKLKGFQRSCPFVYGSLLLYLSSACVFTSHFAVILQGCSQVSLAEFNAEVSLSKWYNILNFHFLQLNPRLETESCSSETGGDAVVSESSISINHTPQDSESSSSLLAGSSGRHNTGVKEESSDDSTIISSQTSTLTRHHGKIYYVTTCTQIKSHVLLSIELWARHMHFLQKNKK